MIYIIIYGVGVLLAFIFFMWDTFVAVKKSTYLGEDVTVKDILLDFDGEDCLISMMFWPMILIFLLIYGGCWFWGYLVTKSNIVNLCSAIGKIKLGKGTRDG